MASKATLTINGWGDIEYLLDALQFDRIQRGILESLIGSLYNDLENAEKSLSELKSAPKEPIFQPEWVKDATTNTLAPVDVPMQIRGTELALLRDLLDRFGPHTTRGHYKDHLSSEVRHWISDRIEEIERR